MVAFHLEDVEEPFFQNVAMCNQSAEIVFSIYDFMQNVLGWDEREINQVLGEKGQRLVNCMLSPLPFLSFHASESQVLVIERGIQHVENFG